MTTQPAHPDTTGWAEIRVETPLPMEVAGTLMQLIGTAWPDAVVKTTGRRDLGFGHGHALTMLVDHKRRPKKVTKKAAKVIVGEQAVEADEATSAGVGDSDFLGFDDGWVTMAAPAELSLHLGGVCARLLDSNEDAINYIEWELRTRATDEKPSRAYVLSAARSKGQTPHALRTRAESERDSARATIDRVRALAAQWECEPLGTHQDQHLHREGCPACSLTDALRAVLDGGGA